MPLSKLVFGFICLLVVTLVFWANVCEVTALVVDEAKSLDEDQFWYDEFAINMSVEVRVSAEISSGPAVDLYVVDKLSFDGLQRVARQWISSPVSLKWRRRTRNATL